MTDQTLAPDAAEAAPEANPGGNGNGNGNGHAPVPNNLLEAPAVVFTQLYGVKEGQVAQFNLTIRAMTPEEALDKIVAGIAYAQQKYKLSLTRPDLRQAPAQQAQAAPAAPASPAAPPAPAGPPAPAAQPPTTEGQNGVIHAVEMEVTPYQDGKVELSFYEAGHRYPDIRTKRTAEAALQLLHTVNGLWTPDHLAQVARYPIKYAILWRASEKLNSKGKPYKDIVEIRAE